MRREMEDLLRGRGALLVVGKSGIGKTREAVHLAQMLNNEGWTVLYLRPDAWLDAPSRPLDGVPARKLLLLLDNLNAHCHRARREVSPRADSLAMPLHEPFQKRLLRTLEALEAFYGRGEILVLATARNERVPEREGEPAEWDKLEWERYPDLWGRFALYEVPELDPEVAACLLEGLGKAAGVCVEGAETIARRNDGTLRNLVENLDMAANPERGLPALTPETFRDTLRGTWASATGGPWSAIRRRSTSTGRRCCCGATASPWNAAPSCPWPGTCCRGGARGSGGCACRAPCGT